MRKLSVVLFFLIGILSAQPPTPWQGGDVHLALPPDSFTLAGVTRNVAQAAYGFFTTEGLTSAVYGVNNFDKVLPCSGRGCHPLTIHYRRTCAWDLAGNVLMCLPGNIEQPLPIAVVNIVIPPPGFGVTRVVTFATDGAVDVGSNKVYGNTTYDFSGFIHPTVLP